MRMIWPAHHYDRPLAERWNVAMSHVGFAGGEWVDEPERVAARIEELRNELYRLRLEQAKTRRLDSERRATDHSAAYAARRLETEGRSTP